MSVWAHPDDDLLFFQTLLAGEIAAGDCVRTVFVTSGDAGRGPAYAQGREAAIMRAYDVMRGKSSTWTEHDVLLSTGARAAVWQPADDDRHSLTFLHLPDGNLNGQGYPSTGQSSLAALAADKIPAIRSVDGSYQLTWSQLVDSLGELITLFAPDRFATHVPGAALKWAKGDHADHAITGVAARKAWQGTGRDLSRVTYAIGYGGVNFPPDVLGDALTQKIAVFRAYATGDPVVASCTTDATCLALPRFGEWLQRQYTKNETELWQ